VSVSDTGVREGSLQAPSRHPLDWRSPGFTDEQALEKELERVFDICHGCRRCFNLCNSFPTLFDAVDATTSGEVLLDGEPASRTQLRAGWQSVADFVSSKAKVAKKTNGATDGDALMAAMKGMAWESPRGPISIDPETRDIVQNIYIRKVEKVDGELYNVEFATFEAVKDSGKTKK